MGPVASLEDEPTVSGVAIGEAGEALPAEVAHRMGSFVPGLLPDVRVQVLPIGDAGVERDLAKRPENGVVGGAVVELAGADEIRFHEIEVGIELARDVGDPVAEIGEDERIRVAGSDCGHGLGDRQDLVVRIWLVANLVADPPGEIGGEIAGDRTGNPRAAVERHRSPVLTQPGDPGNVRSSALPGLDLETSVGPQHQGVRPKIVEIGVGKGSRRIPHGRDQGTDGHRMRPNPGRSSAEAIRQGDFGRDRGGCGRRLRLGRKRRRS